MHGLGMLAPVVKAAAEACREADALAVKTVALRVGTLCNTASGELEGAWPMAVAGTVVEGAELIVEEVAAAVWCPACDAEREIDAFYALRCPACGTPTGDLVRGREFEVVYVELEVPDHA